MREGEDMTDDITDLISSKIRSILKINRPESRDGERTYHTIQLTDDSRDLWSQFAAVCRDKVQNGFFPNCEAFGEKLAGHAIRLAGTVHFLKYDFPHEHRIDATSMEAGIALAEFFAKHAVIAYGENSQLGIKYALKILKWMDCHRRTQFTERQALRGVGHCKIIDIRAGLEVLEQHGYVGRYFNAKTTYCIVNPQYRFNDSSL